MYIDTGKNQSFDPPILTNSTRNSVKTLYALGKIKTNGGIRITSKVYVQLAQVR